MSTTTTDRHDGPCPRCGALAVRVGHDYIECVGCRAVNLV